MTVKELIKELQNVPEDAIVLADHHLHGLYEVVERVEYNDPQNVIYFWGNEIYDPEDYDDSDPCEYCEAGVCHGCCNDIPDDIDETNYDPYLGQDTYDTYSIDEEW